MNLGQDVVSDIRAEADRRIGEFFLSKSRLNRIGQLLAAMSGKVDPSVLAPKQNKLASLKATALVIDDGLGALSEELKKTSPDYIKLITYTELFAKMEIFGKDVKALESDVEGSAKGAGVPTEPMNPLTIWSLVVAASLILSNLLRKRK